MGLLAVWREALLAKKVLQNRTKGYKHHPQLTRFRTQLDPMLAIDMYLSTILKESCARNYRFDSSKVGSSNSAVQILCTTGQVEHEVHHLKKKLEIRAPEFLSGLNSVEVNPLFKIVEGEIERWEKI